MSNPFDQVVFGGLTSNFSSASFGKIGSGGGARQITVSTKDPLLMQVYEEHETARPLRRRPEDFLDASGAIQEVEAG